MIHRQSIIALFPIAYSAHLALDAIGNNAMRTVQRVGVCPFPSRQSLVRRAPFLERPGGHVYLRICGNQHRAAEPPEPAVVLPTGLRVAIDPQHAIRPRVLQNDIDGQERGVHNHLERERGDMIKSGPLKKQLVPMMSWKKLVL